MRSKKVIERQLRAVEVELEEIIEDRDTPGITDLKFALYHVWTTLLWVIHNEWKDRPETLKLGPYEICLDHHEGHFAESHRLHVYKVEEDGHRRELFIF